jgi:NitT/TauT family transport system ATP-binding protein
VMMLQRHASSSSTASGQHGTPVSPTANGASDRSRALLRMSGVEYTYPTGVKAVGGCEIEIDAGEIVALTGPSGCGKTTILNLIAELVSPDTGSIVWDEGYFAQPDRSDGTRLGMVFQRDTVFPWRTVERNVVFGMEHLSMSQSERRERTDELLELANLQEFRKAYPLSLSGGMRRRVALLMSLAVKPAVLLLDEPFGALDEPTRVELLDYLLKFAYRNSTSVVLVTHDLGEAISIADRVIVMSSRPCRVQHVVKVPFGHERNVFKIRERPEYAGLYGELWHELWDAIAASKA